MESQATPTPEQARPGLSPDQLTGTGIQEAGLKALQGEQAPSPATAEVAPPTIGASQSGAPGSVKAQQPQLTADDVAAAIAAVPTPGAPQQVQAPAVAADQDVVEPEWVDAAEQTIAKTAGNPYAEEEAVENLQVDYLKKRYGYEVKKPEES